MKLSRYNIEIDVAGETYIYNLVNGQYYLKSNVMNLKDFFVGKSFDELNYLIKQME